MTALAFGFTKLVVKDLDTCTSFYRDVFGMKPMRHVGTSEHKFALDEVIMSLSGGRDGHALVITRYREMPCPPSGSAWTGFTVPDIDEALRRVSDAGGTVEVPVHSNPEHRVKAAIAADPEGHLIEIIQLDMD